MNGNSGSQGEASGMAHLYDNDLDSAVSPPVADDPEQA
jgi:hypothetical protein